VTKIKSRDYNNLLFDIR